MICPSHLAFLTLFFICLELPLSQPSPSLIQFLLRYTLSSPSLLHPLTPSPPSHFPFLQGLLSVPAFKALTGLPPYLGMLAALGVLWTLTDAIHAGEGTLSLKCVCVYECVCMYVCVCVCVCVCVHMCLMLECALVCVDVCVRICVCVCVWVFHYIWNPPVVWYLDLSYWTPHFILFSFNTCWHLYTFVHMSQFHNIFSYCTFHFRQRKGRADGASCTKKNRYFR